MAGKLLYTVLFGLLFLFAFLLVIRLIRSKEGFANPPPGETYNLELFFKKYPLQRVCQIFEEGFPKVVNTFSIDPKGKSIEPSVAEVQATDYIAKTILTGTINCPVTFPTSNSLNDVHSFVMKLDDMLLAKAFNTTVFFVTNLKITAANSKKLMEGFMTECSQDEIAFQATVPLQCIPAATMKATEQKQINEVDQFDMAQRVSKKSQIAKKLGGLVKNLTDFQTEFKRINQAMIKKNQGLLKKAEFNFNLYKNLEENEENIQKREEYKVEIDQIKNDIQLNTYNVQYASFSLEDLVKQYDKVKTEVESAKIAVNSGELGVPKNEENTRR
jgi:hypothetical protein